MHKRTLHTFFSVLLITGLSTIARGQDLHFSQFYETNLLRNPALSGLFTGDYRVQMAMRSQWNSFENGYRTGSLTGEYKMQVGTGDDYITAGIQMLYDISGAVNFSTQQFLPALNYHKSLSKERPMYLSFGVMGGLIRKSLDVSRITTDAQYQTYYNGDLPIAENGLMPSFSTWDASAGLSFNSSFGSREKNMLFLGAAYHHLNRPQNAFYRNAGIELLPKYVFSAGVRFPVNEYSLFTLQADYATQGAWSETVAGALYSYNLSANPDNNDYILSAGAFIRWKDAVIPVIKLERQALAIAISYDVNISPLKSGSQLRSGTELTLSYAGFTRKMSSTEQKVVCPRF